MGVLFVCTRMRRFDCLIIFSSLSNKSFSYEKALVLSSPLLNRALERQLYIF